MGFAGPLFASANTIEWRDPDLALGRYEESIALVRQGEAKHLRDSLPS